MLPAAALGYRPPDHEIRRSPDTGEVFPPTLRVSDTPTCSISTRGGFSAVVVSYFAAAVVVVAVVAVVAVVFVMFWVRIGEKKLARTIRWSARARHERWQLTI